MNKKVEIIDFDSLSSEAKQEWVDIWLHERERHVDDIMSIDGYLRIAKQRYGIKPRKIYVGKWVEIKP
jgi:poly(3-hydroxybutyrate) depolymerase